MEVREPFAEVSFHLVPEDELRWSGLGSKPLYLLSHLSGSFCPLLTCVNAVSGISGKLLRERCTAYKATPIKGLWFPQQGCAASMLVVVDSSRHIFPTLLSFKVSVTCEEPILACPWLYLSSKWRELIT